MIHSDRNENDSTHRNVGLVEPKVKKNPKPRSNSSDSEFEKF